MTAKNYLRGHLIEFINNEWVYCDTSESTADTGKERPCGHCGLPNTIEGHDGCLGTLPGVMNVCCGHGGKHEGAYIQFLDETCIRHDDAIEIMDVLKKYVRRSKNEEVKRL